MVLLLYSILLLSIFNGHLSYDALLSLSLVAFVLPLWERGLLFCGLRPGFGTAGKTGFGRPLPIGVSEDYAGSYTSPLCVGVYSNGHVRWIRSV